MSKLRNFNLRSAKYIDPAHREVDTHNEGSGLRHFRTRWSVPSHTPLRVHETMGGAGTAADGKGGGYDSSYVPNNPIES